MAGEVRRVRILRDGVHTHEGKHRAGEHVTVELALARLLESKGLAESVPPRLDSPGGSGAAPVTWPKEPVSPQRDAAGSFSCEGDE